MSCDGLVTMLRRLALGDAMWGMSKLFGRGGGLR